MVDKQMSTIEIQRQMTSTW